MGRACDILRREAGARHTRWPVPPEDLETLARELAENDLQTMRRSGTLGRLWAHLLLARLNENPDLGRLFPK